MRAEHSVETQAYLAALTAQFIVYWLKKHSAYAHCEQCRMQDAHASE